MYLSPEEIAELTGLRYAARQIAWLTREHWTFHVDAKGHPKVLRSYAITRGGGQPGATLPGPEPRLQLD